MRYIISRMEYSHRRSKQLAQKTILAKRDPWKITSNKTYSPKVFIVKIPRFCHKLTLLYPCNSQVAADPDKLCSCLRLELQRGWERAKVGHVRCTVKDTYHFNFLFIFFVHLVCSFRPCLESFLQGGIQTYHWMQSRCTCFLYWNHPDIMADTCFIPLSLFFKGFKTFKTKPDSFCATGDEQWSVSFALVLATRWQYYWCLT